MKRGAIFDMDGVLVNNVSYHVYAWKQFGREMGRDLTEEQIRAVFGQRNNEMVNKLVGPGISEEDVIRLAERKEQVYRDCIAHDLHPVPGLHDFLESLNKAGIRCAVATSGPKANADFVLDRLGISGTFDAVITGEQVTRSKPEPDIFLLAARQIGIPAGHCVVFEDSAVGIEAARRAGCECIALATTHSAEELQAFPVSRIVRDFRGMSAADLDGGGPKAF